MIGLAAELEHLPVTAVGVTPGWLRSEMMPENFGITEASWRDACVSTPGFAISESPAYVARGIAALLPGGLWLETGGRRGHRPVPLIQARPPVHAGPLVQADLVQFRLANQRRTCLGQVTRGTGGLGALGLGPVPGEVERGTRRLLLVHEGPAQAGVRLAWIGEVAVHDGQFRGAVSVQRALPLGRRELPRLGAQQRRVIRAPGQLLGQGRYLRGTRPRPRRSPGRPGRTAAPTRE